MLVVIICFAFVDPRRVFPPSGSASMSLVSSAPNLNLKLEAGSILELPPSTAMV